MGLNFACKKQFDFMTNLCKRWRRQTDSPVPWCLSSFWEEVAGFDFLSNYSKAKAIITHPELQCKPESLVLLS